MKQPINQADKRILELFEQYFKTIEIAKITGASVNHIRKLTRAHYTQAALNKIKRQRSEFLSIRYRTQFHQRYHEDPVFRELIKAKSRSYYERSKRARDKAKRAG